ncbi:hypothetical protein G4O51_12515 [Candidatus Bathyarchaeota archaeon A05DMB-2]|jgi:hypothetical protein|nr:hypothetical protein [Candidatus Bathyarchaeota archaeon A05DMB-2]
MPKWKSAIFSDIRNAIGEQVTFSMWKGRPYMRTYTRPANPNTAKQAAGRDVMKQLVKRYQEIMADPEVKAAWNEKALPYMISGFNLFTKYGRLSKIALDKSSGSAPLSVTITYSSGIPIANAGIVKFNGSQWSIVKDVGTLEAGEDKTVEVTGLTAGTYYFFLADLTVLKTGDTKPQAYQAVTKWKPDMVNGVAQEAKVVVS